MKPTVGRTVHYTNRADADEQYAAIITKVRNVHSDNEVHDSGECPEDCYEVSLFVLHENDYFFRMKIPFSKEYKRGHWTWPKREG